ncbi:MaoC family dehydratase N-terminal domain-containing protein [Streptomyces sp. NPDC020412]|uniref:MaoC family dehydratase N-terminal domain-containing protein n=1 Tax=Streptomyces sp. NPDC020412 TaxID=3365073 RepID=UPI0037B916E4
MPLDRSLIGTTSPELVVDVERGRLRFFAKATGQTDPVYRDLDAARAAGHRDLPVPPTFLFCLGMDVPNPFEHLEKLGIDPVTVLHGEQGFEYLAPVYAGDTLTYSTRISDIYEKKGGALEFLVRTTEVTRDGEPVARLTASAVIRHKVDRHKVDRDKTDKEATA